MSTKKNWIGLKFGRLTVVSELPSVNQKRRLRCICDCGEQSDVQASNLTSRHTKSCGCFQIEARIVHGLAYKPVYSAWQHMVERCYKPHAQEFHRYGGRGILVCEWLRASAANIVQLIGDRPSNRHSIDRPNNDGMYSCGACAECLQKQWSKNLKWSTRKEQQRNMSRNRFFTFDGESKTIAEWAEIKGINQNKLRGRIELGWPNPFI